MTTPAKINFKINQGTTFAEVLRWESSTKTYIPITAIDKSAPLVVTAPAHGVPPEWRVKFTNIVGMTDLNSNDNYYQVTSVTTDTLTINSVNSLGFKAYTSGGIVEYNTPVDLAGFTGHMQIRPNINSDQIIDELTSENGGIIINNTNKTITITISPEATSAYTFNTAVYSLDIISSGGQITPFCAGTLSLIQGVTR